MPSPRTHNASVYIILCGRRIGVAATNDPIEKIKEASSAAVEVVSQLEILHPKEMTAELASPVSDLQHEMMDHLFQMSAAEVDEKVAEMFELLDALEDHFG
jgi:hypothetical protein